MNSEYPEPRSSGQLNTTEANTTQDGSKTSSGSSISRLPTEIICDILSYLAIDDSSEATRDILLNVCHQWREIVNSTPCFWTTVHLINGLEAMDFDTFISNTAKTRSSLFSVHWDMEECHDLINPRIVDISKRYHRIFQCIPFERWGSLNLGALTNQVFIPEHANFKNLVTLEVVANINMINMKMWRGIMGRIAETARGLQTLKTNTYGWDFLAHINPSDLKTIFSRISTLTCDVTPPLALLGDDETFPPNVSTLKLDSYEDVPFDFGSIKHLEIRLLELDVVMDCSFLNVEVFHIGEILDLGQRRPLHLPKLRELVYSGHFLNHLELFLAPLLERIRFPSMISKSSTKHGGYSNIFPPFKGLSMRPTIINFDKGIQIDLLYSVLLAFPNMKHLYAVITPANDSNMALETTRITLEKAFLSVGSLSSGKEGETEDMGPLKAIILHFDIGPQLIDITFKLSSEWDDSLNPVWDEFLPLMLKARGPLMKEIRYERPNGSRTLYRYDAAVIKHS